MTESAGKLSEFATADEVDSVTMQPTSSITASQSRARLPTGRTQRRRAAGSRISGEMNPHDVISIVSAEGFYELFPLSWWEKHLDGNRRGSTWQSSDPRGDQGGCGADQWSSRCDREGRGCRGNQTASETQETVETVVRAGSREDG